MTTTNIITKQIIVGEDELIERLSTSPPSSLSLHPSSLPARQRWLKMATSDVDRAGDILLLSGMDATNFLKNPQFLWQHGKSGAQVNTIGRVLNLDVRSTSLLALVEYAPADVNPLAEQVFQMDTLGLLPANSIGFRPLEWEANDFGGHTFTKWELIECSKVELPMNPQAVDSRAWREDTDECPPLDMLQPKATSVQDAAEWLTN